MPAHLIKTDLTALDAHEPTAGELDDIPEITNADFARAVFETNGVPTRRGRPPAVAPKRPVTIRLDPDVVAHFQADGPGWQSRINAALRKVAKLPKVS